LLDAVRFGAGVASGTRRILNWSLFTTAWTIVEKR
jgi:hypothetical protein